MTFQKTRSLIFFMTALLLADPKIPFVSAQNADSDSILRLGTYRKLAPLNPFENSDTFSTPLMELVFNRLVRYDEEGDFEPDLAQAWKISEDGETYTFFLREGVKFHDGLECTAEDVEYSLKLAGDSIFSSSPVGPLKIIREMKAVSKYVLEIRLREPFAPFLLSVWRVHIIPRHALEKFPEDLPEFLKKPIGTGPFVFSSQDNGGIRLEANLDYFEGAPQSAGVDVRVYNDKEQNWSSFLRDESDLFFYLDWKNYSEINKHSDFNVFRSLSASGYALIFNLQRPLLQEPKVREAIVSAINRRELIDVLENGEGVLMDGPFHPHSWAYNSEVPPAVYDPEKTLRLLEEAGFKKTKNGIEKNGKKLELNLLLDAKNDQLIRLSKLIRQQLYEAGISVSFHFFDSYSELKEKFYEDNQMDAYLLIISTGPEPDAVSRYWFTGENVNRSHYSRADVDAFFNKARVVSDRNVRKAAYQKIHAIIAADAPAAFLYYPYAIHAASRHVRGAEEMVGPFILFHKLKDVRKQAVNSSKRR